MIHTLSINWLVYMYLNAFLNASNVLNAFEGMAPTAEQFSGAWGPRVLRAQTSQYVRCRPYC